MSITKNTEYALRALYEIAAAGDGKPVKRRAIAKSQNISEPFLEKIFISMNKAGIIKSVRGPGGGFILDKDAADITVWDVFSAVDNKGLFYEKCAVFQDNRECEQYEECKIKHVWTKINQAVKDSMNGISLELLFSDGLDTGGE